MSMILTKKSGGDFVPHPETDGLVKAVIVDITALKKMPSQFGERDVFKLVYESEVMDETATPPRNFGVWSMPYTPSLNEKANFRKDLKKILGRDLTIEEESSFDVEATLLGWPVQIIIKHETKGDNTYAQISHVQPDKSDKPMKPSGKFIREKDRQKKDAASGDSASYRKAGGAAEDSGRAPWQKCKVHVGPSKGLDLGDLDEPAVRDLLEKFLPKHTERVAGTLTDRKPTADDGRLAAALIEAEKLLTEAAASPY